MTWVLMVLLSGDSTDTAGRSLFAFRFNTQAAANAAADNLSARNGVWTWVIQD